MLVNVFIFISAWFVECFSSPIRDRPCRRATYFEEYQKNIRKRGTVLVLVCLVPR